MRRTKIICAPGPASEKAETLRQLSHEGTDVFRLNTSHDQRNWVREIVPRIRTIAQELGRAVAISWIRRVQPSAPAILNLIRT